MISLFCHLFFLFHLLVVSECVSFRPPVLKAVLPPTNMAANTNKLLPIQQKIPVPPSIEQKQPLQKQSKADLYQLTFFGLMFCGALSRTAAALAIHPLHAIKINLQVPAVSIPSSVVSSQSLLSWTTLTRGLSTQLLFTLPHGALSFAVIELTKQWLLKSASSHDLTKGLNPVLDLLAASVSSLVCSIISIPQMLLTDRIMVGQYSSVSSALQSILRTDGIRGLYQGWVPGMLLKLPSTALTWMFYQQLRRYTVTAQLNSSKLGLASLAAAASCILMTPIDTIKTRLIMQGRDLPLHPSPGTMPESQTYAGMLDCFHQVLYSEGWTAFFKSLPPRLLSVVPMIGIQFAIFESLKTSLLQEYVNSAFCTLKRPSLIPYNAGDGEEYATVDSKRVNPVLRSPLRSWLTRGRGGGEGRGEGSGEERGDDVTPRSDADTGSDDTTSDQGRELLSSTKKRDSSVVSIDDQTSADVSDSPGHDQVDRGEQKGEKPSPPSRPRPSSCDVV